MKAYTDLEQSKKLAKILPLESADIWFANGIYLIKTSKEPKDIQGVFSCWSLAALLNYLRKIDFFPNIKADEHSVTMNIDYYDEKEARPLAPVHSIKVKADNMIDVCYEIIIKLHEQNLL